jgi:hypothetical protein
MRSEGIKSVVVATAKPSGPGDPGQCAEGHYFIEHGILTMCDRDGVPLRDENTGRQVALRLLAGDDEKGFAKKLTLQQHRAANREDVAGWGRRINYGRNGYA